MRVESCFKSTINNLQLTVKGRFAPICVAACLAETFGYMYDFALTGSLPPCGEGGQFALRIGRMRGFAEGDRAVNDCLASRRLCCYAKWKCSAVRQPPLIVNLSAQASRHLPHKGEGFLFRQRFCLASGDSSTSLRMTAGGNGKQPSVSVKERLLL